MSMNHRQKWIELRSHGRLWARYNPQTNQVEFARQDVRAVFDLSKIQRQQQNQDATLQSTTNVVESMA